MTCKICLSHTKTIEDAQLLKTYYACPHCEAFFLDEAFFLSHEQEQKMYSQHNNSLENEGYVLHHFDTPQLGTNHKTSLLILTKPGVTHKEVYHNLQKLYAAPRKKQILCRSHR